MRRRRTVSSYASYLVLAGMLCAAAVSTAFAGSQDFTLVNRTGFQIRRVFLSPHRSAEWGEDVLGRDVLVDGERVRIRFGRRARAAHWDLKIVERSGKSFTWDNLNLLEIDEVILHYERGRTWADFK